MCLDVAEDFAIRGVKSVRLGREREVDHGLRECEVAFGRAEEVDGVAGRESEVECFGRGEADVFDGHADDAASDVHGVFAGLEHAAKPVERGVGVAVANGFVQRGDEIVVLFARLVVEQDALLERLRERVPRVMVDVLPLWASCRGDIESVVGAARVAAGVCGDEGECVFVGGESKTAEAAIAVVERAVKQDYDLRLRSAGRSV